MGERPDRKWAALEVGLIVPRQNGKGSVLEARELFGLFLAGEQLILHSAHEFKTAQEAFLRVLALVENTPDLENRVARVRTAHGSEGIELKDGARLRFVARTGGSGRGFSGDCVILDEAYELAPKTVSALLPTMSARMDMTVGGPQVWYTSSAPLLDSGVLRRLRKRGIEGDSRLCFMEWSTPEDADLDDHDAWAQANPGLGLRITEDFIETVERGGMLPEDFARERLGIAPDPSVIAAAIPQELWLACQDPNSTFVGQPIVVVDVTPDRSRASIAAAALRADGLPHVEVVQNGSGTEWVVPKLLALTTRPRRILVVGTDPAGSLIAAGQAAGLEIEAVSTADHAKACGLLFDLVMQGRMRHRVDPLLDTALAGAVRREVADGAWLWSRKNSLVDISPLVASTIALWAASERHGPGGFVDLNDFQDE